MYGLLSILMEVKIRELQKNTFPIIFFCIHPSIHSFAVSTFEARVYFHYSFGVKLTQIKMGLQKLSTKNKRTLFFLKGLFSGSSFTASYSKFKCTCQRKKQVFIVLM